MARHKKVVIENAVTEEGKPVEIDVELPEEGEMEETKPMAIEDKVDMLMDEVNALKEQLAAMFGDEDEPEEEEEEEADLTPYMQCSNCGGRLMQFHERGWLHESGMVDHEELVLACQGCHKVQSVDDLIVGPALEQA
jgi:hypothetical protein